MQRTQTTNRRDLKGRPGSLKTAVEIILAYRRSLSALGARKDVIDSLDAALAILKSPDVNSAFPEISGTNMKKSEDVLRDKDVATLPEPEIAAIINDKEVTRRTLERIAIERFSVPKGSMRSYPNIMLLKEKLKTLMQNDVTHQAISEVSRRAG